MDFKIDTKEKVLIVVIAVMGFIFSTKSFLMFLDTLNPLQGLGFYYLMLYAILFVLSKMGLAIFNLRIEKPLQVLGTLMVMFSFFVVINWESPYIQYIHTGNMSSMNDVSPVFYGSEDGATFYFWNVVLGITNIEILRLLTFVLTPLILTTIGTWLATRVKL